jgi:hypothetical protein
LLQTFCLQILNENLLIEKKTIGYRDILEQSNKSKIPKNTDAL